MARAKLEAMAKEMGISVSQLLAMIAEGDRPSGSDIRNLPSRPPPANPPMPKAKPVAKKCGGKVRSMKRGGKVRGCGIAKRGKSFRMR